jgi:hypothetical protein
MTHTPEPTGAAEPNGRIPPTDLSRAMRRAPPTWWTPLAWFALLAFALLAMGWWPGVRDTPLPALLFWWTAFGAYLGAFRYADQAPRSLIWAGGVLLRVGLLPLAPHFSDDMYRYIWDGWVARNGLNPFLYAPADPQLEGLRTDWWSLINHPEIPTIYPPGAQVVFAAVASLTLALPVFKLVWIMADLGTAWLLGRLAHRRLGPGRHRPLLLYLWSPLVVVEVAWSGHLEPLGLLPMMAAIMLLEAGTGRGEKPEREGRKISGGALLGLGAAVKFAPLAAWPAVLRRHGPKAALASLVVPALLYTPYASAGGRLFEALGTYAERWEFNPGLFHLLVQSLGGGTTPRWAAAGVVIGAAVWAAWKRWTVDRTLFWTIGAALLLSPTIHPWYVVWILPFACLYQSGPWLAFTGTVFLGYAGRDMYHATGVWPQPAWLALLVHAPLVGWLLVQAATRRLAGGRQIPHGEQTRERNGREESGLDEAGHRAGE